MRALFTKPSRALLAATVALACSLPPRPLTRFPVAPRSPDTRDAARVHLPRGAHGGTRGHAEGNRRGRTGHRNRL